MRTGWRAGAHTRAGARARGYLAGAAMSQLPKSAVERALEQAQDAAVFVPAQQLPLIPTEISRAETQGAAPVGRGSGRPPGAKNKRAVEMASYLTANYRHPLVGLAEIFNRPVEVLAAQLGCTKLDAFRMQMDAMVQLAPYVAQKLPQMVDFRGTLDLTEGQTEAEMRADIARLAREVGVVIDIEPNQEVKPK